MSIQAKPFQQATIDAALRTLGRKTGARRFLVADEVGLGKTVVASGIIQALVLLGFVLIAARLASYVPLATLSAIVMVVAITMGEWHEFK